MLSARTRLGPYEIVAPLGQGGMGEVYKARDTRLDRTVAIKVLPAALAADPQFRERFDREARAIAALNHPHICTLYDIGEAPNPQSQIPNPEKVQFLVMEYLEGETLARRLENGPLPLDQALTMAIQIADALATAHGVGITHRDLKPGNVMLTKSGAKLLDFGLAKTTGGAQGVGRVLGTAGEPSPKDPAYVPTVLPTTPPNLTAEGTILGTFQYMAPEQLEGKDADARTDIFAFGAVVYEMVTGRKAFEGKSQASLISAIMSSDPPPMASLQPLAPVSLNRVVKKCLAKEPEKRWQSASDLHDELKWIADAGSQAAAGAPGTQLATGATTSTRSRLGTRERLGWVLLSIALALMALGAGAQNYFRRPTTNNSRVEFAVSAPEKTTFAGAGFAAYIPSPSVSPDGHRLAFVVVGPSGTPSLWVRALDSSNAQALPGTEGASYPFWSPNGRFIGFFAQGKLKKIDLSGGAPQTLCDVGGGGGRAGVEGGGTWNRDDVIAFAPSIVSPLFRVSATGGQPTALTALDSSRQETAHLWPYFLPDGRHFLYLVRSAMQGTSGIFVGSIDAKETKRLVSADSAAVYAPQGYLLFLTGTDLMAQPFNADRLETTGAPVRVAEGIQFNLVVNNYGAFSVSQNDTLVYRTGPGAPESQLVWLDRMGKQLGQVGAQATLLVPSLSPDESKVAVTIANDVWVLDVVRNTSSRLTFDGTAVIPIWSPDGGHILYRSQRASPGDLYQKLSTGTGTEEALSKSNTQKSPTDWSLDGRFIVYETQDPKTNVDIWALPTSGDRPSTSSGRPEPAEGRKPFPLLQTESNEQQARISPDGRWIAYTSDETGKPEIYVQSFPAAGGKWQISTAGGADARWRRDGKELFFISTDRKLMAVDVKADATIQAGLPHELFDARVSGLTDVRTHYAVSRDGQRFLVNRLSEGDASSPITVVLNWTAGLKK